MKGLLRLKSQPTYWTAARVDRRNLMIHDAVAMTANTEAVGHNIMTDLKSLHLVAALANQHRGGLGLQGRFGHPGASENAMGKKFMVSRNFRVSGDKLLHDIHLMNEARTSPAFGGADVVEYVLGMAESQPQEIAESAVLSTDLVWTLADGTEAPYKGGDPSWLSPDEIAAERPEQALTALPVMRPTRVAYLDLVNEGALTHDGLFSAEFAAKAFEGTSNAYAQELFFLVDEWRDEYGVPLEDLPGKVNDMMSRYLAVRGASMSDKAKAETRTLVRGTKGRAARLDAPGTPPTPTPTDAEDDEILDGDQPEAEDAPDDGLDQIADQAEQTAVATAPAPGESDTPSAEGDTPASLDSAARVASLEGELAALKETVKTLTRIAVANTRTLTNMRQDIARIDGEPVVRGKVSNFAARGLGGNKPVVPSATLQRQQPRGLGETAEKGGAPKDSDALTVLQINAQRNNR